MNQEMLYLPNSPKLRGVLERKREHFKECALKMGALGDEYSHREKLIYGLRTGYGRDYSLLHLLLEKGKVDPLRIASMLYYSLPQRTKETDSVRMHRRPEEKEEFIANVLVCAHEWKKYMQPIEGVPDEFMGFHDRGYAMKVAFPGREDENLVLLVDHLLRIRSAYPDSKGIITPVPINFLGKKTKYFAMVHGSLSFPEIGVINTGRKRLETLEKGDRIDVIPSSGAGQVLRGSEIVNIEHYVHDLRQDGGQFETYLKNLPSATPRGNPFEEMFNEGGRVLENMAREGGEELVNIVRRGKNEY